MKSKLKGYVVNLLIYGLIIAGTVFGMPRFLSFVLKTQYPMAAITSGSMWPALNKGDLVVIQGVPKEKLNVGDIIVYRNEGGPGFTIHRIVKIGEKTVTTKGDANFTEDNPVPYENIVGKSLIAFGKPLRIPLLGSVTMFANSVRSNN